MTDGPIKLRVESDAVMERLAQLRQRGGSLRKPLSACGQIVLGSIEQNFRQQGRFQEAGSWRGGSRRWAPLADSSKTRIAGGARKRYKQRGGERAEAKRRIAGHKILQDTGQLAASIHVSASGNTVEIGTNKAYAAAHNFGFNDTVAVPEHQRTSSKGNRYRVRSHSKKMKLPARPFMVVQDQDVEDMIDVLDRHLLS